jgi:diguanylate cyclase (GGDEF)-like protein
VKTIKFKTLFTRFLAMFVALIITIQALNYIALLGMPFSLINSWIIFILIGAVAGAGSLFFSRLMADNLKKSLVQLMEGVRSVESGQKDDPIDLGREDEFADLAEALNNLIDRDKAIRHANEDALTGLANRRYLMQRLEKLLAQDRELTVMFIDLDGFKPINDTYGHDAGDEALRMVAERLLACTREHDVVCRLGGDEFVLVFNGLVDEDVLKERGDKVLEMLGTPMWIDGNRIRMGGSIGIAVAPKDGKDAETILNASDEAMYAAKQGGKNAYRFYS